MNVLVIGAAGKTGRLVVERAAAAGHRVTAFVRDADGYQPGAVGVCVVTGDAQDAARMNDAMTGQEAVIDAIGGKVPFVATDLEQSVARCVLAAMKQQGVRRLVVISVLGAGDSKEQEGFFYNHLLRPFFLRGAVPDKEAMEAEVEQSGVDFVLARPAVLSDDPATGSVQVFEGDEMAHKITRADLAQFLVDQLASDTYLGRTVTIANK